MSVPKINNKQKEQAWHWSFLFFQYLDIQISWKFICQIKEEFVQTLLSLKSSNLRPGTFSMSSSMSSSILLYPRWSSFRFGQFRSRGINFIWLWCRYSCSSLWIQCNEKLVKFIFLTLSKTFLYSFIKRKYLIELLTDLAMSSSVSSRSVRPLLLASRKIRWRWKIINILLKLNWNTYESS